jgi:hypothetical protein
MDWRDSKQVNRCPILWDNVDEGLLIGYVYARTLYHIAFSVGKIDGVDTELQILGNLLSQKRWLLGKRGYVIWYQPLVFRLLKMLLIGAATTVLHAFT